MINQKEIEAWVLSLEIAKQYGIGVDGIYSDREKPQGIVNTTIDDILNDLDLMLISRALGEAVWKIDFKLYTRESLAKAELIGYWSLTMKTCSSTLLQDFVVVEALNGHQILLITIKTNLNKQL